MAIEILAKNIGKSYGKKVVFENLSFNIRPNEIFGIIGRSGSGKTVLLKTLAGIISPTRGSVFYNGTSAKEDQFEIKKKIGFSFQESSFYLSLTVLENLYFFGNLYGLDKKELEGNIRMFLKMFELTDFKNVLAKNLSGGTQKRLDIACSIIHFPSVLFLDEPMMGLDPFLRRDLLALFNNIRRGKVTLVVTSHFIDEMAKICDRIAMFDRNNRLIIGPPERIIQEFEIASKKEEKWQS